MNKQEIHPQSVGLSSFFCRKFDFFRKKKKEIKSKRKKKEEEEEDKE